MRSSPCRARAALIPLLLLLSAAGCSFLPPPPPLLPAAVGQPQLSISVGRIILPLEARVTSPSSGPVTLKQTLDGEAPAAFPALFDPRLALAVPLSEQLTLAGHLSWLTIGPELRYALNGLSARIPVLVYLGAQLDGPLQVYYQPLPGFAWETRAGVGIQPRLGTRLQLILGAGTSFGPRRRGAIAPDESIGMNEADNIRPAEMNLLRREWHLEGMAGIAVAMRKLRFLVSAQPFRVLHARTLESECYLCVPDATLLSFEANWGVALQLTVALR